ncbi:4-hydroxybutyrate--acetyl-CoA CoA transferase [Clostridium bovifaecis]|uniref:4-hydroxybutyrate--acetyl-CoA CoA transferase n=1 Tax=Clostridium bovifaecis TaxID=2184719 RepID=A0A6I6EWI2_9CLOT|nr:4-hydroxybutyrate--acetyl-CoA CoA transferase [Clostridium bovifaecis]
MNYNEQYKNKLISLDEALNKVESNMDIVAGLAAMEPMDFMSRLHEVKDKVENVRVFTCLNMGNYKFFSEPDMAGHFINAAWFYTPPIRKAHPYGTTNFVPNHLHKSAADRISTRAPKMFIGTATPMDKHGYFNLSLTATYEKLLLEAADIVILEIDPNYPRTFGDTNVHISQVDYVYETARPVPIFPYAPSNKKDIIIGNYIAELIEDGSTIQLGIGGIPNAVAAALRDKKDLGIHTELLTDGMIDLIEAGVITNNRKTLHRGVSVATMILGSERLYDFIDQNPGVAVMNGDYVNDPYVIGQNYKQVSINTTLEVDLTGQCCSESVGSSQFSGTGGQADTAIGAQKSLGGKSIIALYSTFTDKATGQQKSKIVPTLTPGAIVSLSRNDVEYVVTEYGVTCLKGKTVKDRVNGLISIAHPDFRGELREQANKLMLW